MTRLLAPLVCTMLIGLAACAQVTVATPTPINVTIGGATAMQPVVYELTNEFTRQHPNVRFDVRGGGSTLGEERLLAGKLTWPPAPCPHLNWWNPPLWPALNWFVSPLGWMRWPLSFTPAIQRPH